jgi:probable HAF family extracellular repeat protein
VATPAPSNYPTLGGSASVYSSNSVAAVGISHFSGAGADAVRWVTSNGTVTLTDLGVLPGAGSPGGRPSSVAYGLNLVGDIVGQSDTHYLSNIVNSTQTVPHAFLWNSGVMTDLGTIAGENYTSAANGVNDSHEIVGVTNTISSASGQILNRAFVHIGGTMYNLTFFLVGGPTALLSDATAIDCQGNISAVGTPAAGGSTHTYLLVRQGTARTGCPQ